MKECSIISNNALTGIADSIRSKIRSLGGMRVSEMADKIRSITDYSELGSMVLTGSALSLNNEFSDWGKPIDCVFFPYCREISGEAFYNLKDLEKAYLPMCNSITGAAFGKCVKLYEVDIHECRELGASVFRECSSLGGVSLPMCTDIGNYAFAGSGLAGAAFPRCASIGDRAFEDCASLSTVELTGCTSIGELAFSGCTYLRSVVITNYIVPGPDVPAVAAGLCEHWGISAENVAECVVQFKNYRHVVHHES